MGRDRQNRPRNKRTSRERCDGHSRGALDDHGLQQLAKQLKQHCGSGGTVKDSVIEIQGDHRDRLMEELKKRGYTVRRSGGVGEATLSEVEGLAGVTRVYSLYLLSLIVDSAL